MLLKSGVNVITRLMTPRHAQLDPEARILVDGARPADTASATNASLCRYSGRRFIVASERAESRGGLVLASLAVVSAGKSRRCGADSAETFARGVGLSSASAEWQARRTNHIMLQGEIQG